MKVSLAPDRAELVRHLGRAVVPLHDRQAEMNRRTKIVATIGPASDSVESLRELMTAGVDVIRLNLSHGAVEDHLVRLERVRRAADEVGRHVAVMADLPGPKIRAGEFPVGGVRLEAGTIVEMRPGDGASGTNLITVPYPTLLTDLHVGSRVQLGDGAISLAIESIDDSSATARVATGGHVSGQPGVHLSADTLRLMTPTEEDLALAEIVAGEGVDFIAVSFVRRGGDLDQVRDVVGRRAQLIAKIETQSSVEHLDEIVAAADAVMVARGDLGIDCPIEDVPHLQKQIVRHCVEAGVPVITATQMLESMISAPSPTRAEVSDIANAVFDGSDAIMLSGETAIGHDPVGVVETMAKIAIRAESEADYAHWAVRLGRLQSRGDSLATRHIDSTTAAITHAASQAATDFDVKAILCCTNSGRTARAMARFRPTTTLLAVSPHLATLRSMSLSWGVEPLLVEPHDSTDEMISSVVEAVRCTGLAARGDTVFVLAGVAGRDRIPGHSGPATNALRIVRVE